MTAAPKPYYNFRKSIVKRRWISMWHQLDEVFATGSRDILEIGPGSNTFKTAANHFGLNVKTLDRVATRKPDYLMSATDMTFEPGTFDLVCAFQVLEHMPYDQSLIAFENMVRTTKRHIVISLPDASHGKRFEFYTRKIGRLKIPLLRRYKLRNHKFDGSHHWEINKRGYELEKVQADFEQRAKLVRTYLVPENTYHRFFVFEKPDV